MREEFTGRKPDNVQYISTELRRPETTVPSLSNGPYFEASNICMQPLSNWIGVTHGCPVVGQYRQWPCQVVHVLSNEHVGSHIWVKGLSQANKSASMLNRHWDSLKNIFMSKVLIFYVEINLHMQHKDMRPSVNFQKVSMWRSKNMTDNQLPYDGEGTVISGMWRFKQHRIFV